MAEDFRPIRPLDGYLPLEDYGLIGDGATAGLVGRDGSLAWLCVPRFDSSALFCSLLDRDRGGVFRLAPEGLRDARQRYEPDTGVLVTELRGPAGLLRLTDALLLRPEADMAAGEAAASGALLRVAEVVEGSVRLRVEIEPRGGADAEPVPSGLRLRCRRRPDLPLRLLSTQPLNGLSGERELRAGERLDLVLAWGDPQSAVSSSPAEALAATLATWRRWARCLRYYGPQEAMVRRSAVTLKLLDHIANGALVAAPTSSLPEAIGGERNWDYRFSWIRDAAFSVYAFRRIGMTLEASLFLDWVLRAVDRAGRPAVLYDLDGRLPPEECNDPELEGYRRSAPVRWGNGAAGQTQHDAYGEILDCAYQHASGGATFRAETWERLRQLADTAADVWRTPDHGIWEVRTDGRLFTYSAAMCQVALDRAARLALREKLPGDARRWSAEAERIRAAIIDQAWDPRTGALTEHLGGGALDASVLALPLRRVMPADHPKMVATTAAVEKVLGAGGGLLYRYLPDQSPDGLEGHEGAFLLCSFWLVDNLANQGRLEEATQLYDELCGRAGPLGLLPEQIDPATGAFLGNYPQAFSHIGVVSSGFNLARRWRQRG